jgi:hypothetical protein
MFDCLRGWKGGVACKGLNRLYGFFTAALYQNHFLSHLYRWCRRIDNRFTFEKPLRVRFTPLSAFWLLFSKKSPHVFSLQAMLFARGVQSDYGLRWFWALSSIALQYGSSLLPSSESEVEPERIRFGLFSR